MPGKHDRMRLASPDIVSDEARIGFNGVCEGYCLCGEARAETSAPEILLWCLHTFFILLCILMYLRKSFILLCILMYLRNLFYQQLFCANAPYDTASHSFLSFSD